MRLASVFLLIGLLAVACAAADPVVRVTGEWMDSNGQTKIPAGMFGVHAMRLTPEIIQDWGIECHRHIVHSPGAMAGVARRSAQRDDLSLVIDCLFDRYQPALLLTDHNWEQTLVDTARAYALACKEEGYAGTVEFWNEPYLNWAVRPGVNYDQKFYETDGREVGAPMTIRGWDRPLEHLVWQRTVMTVHPDGRTDSNSYLAHSHTGHRLPAGQEYEFRGRTYRTVETWWGRDPTQISYWSGLQNGQFYNMMFVPFARTIKETNPDVTVVGGWGFHIYQQGWQAWEMLYKPMIDASIQWLDGVHEHHYGSDPRRTAASYEVVAAYGMSRYGRWLRGYNTEASGRLDTQVPGQEDVPVDGDALRNAIGKMTYELRDILYMLSFLPDKAASRTSHDPQSPAWGAGGVEWAFKLLRPLRGNLVKSDSTDPLIWPVAAINGERLVLAIFNDADSERTVPVAIDAPRGMRFAAGGEGVRGTVHRVVVAGEERPWLSIQSQELAPAQPRHRTQFAGELTIRPRQAVVLEIPLEGIAPEAPVLERRQLFAPEQLFAVGTDEPVTMRIDLDPLLLRRARHAYVQVVVAGNGRDMDLRLNGQPVPVPAGQLFLRIPVDVRMLRRMNELTFAAPARGYRIKAASLIVDAPAP